MNVEIIYIGQDDAIFRKNIQVDRDSPIHLCLKQSGLFSKYPELNREDLQVGIFGEKKTQQDIPEPDDRIEVYRPLKISPMEKRRLLAEKKPIKT